MVRKIKAKKKVISKIPKHYEHLDISKDLKWQVIRIPVYKTMTALEIYSLPNLENPLHKILYPTIGKKFYWVEWQHEFSHAYLCENVHNIFSGGKISKNSIIEHVKNYGRLLTFPADWFVDGELVKRFPDENEPRIKKGCLHWENQFSTIYGKWKGIEVQGLAKGDTLYLNDFFLAVGFAFFLAKIEYYNLDVEVSVSIPDKVERIKDAFCGADPSKPTIESLLNLTNKILQIDGNSQVCLVKSKGIEIWEFRGLT